MWPFPSFHLLMFKNSVLLICLVYIVFFAVYFLLAYLYAKLLTVFVYGSWICIFCYEYIWKSVHYAPTRKARQRMQHMHQTQITYRCNKKLSCCRETARSYNYVHTKYRYDHHHIWTLCIQRRRRTLWCIYYISCLRLF